MKEPIDSVTPILGLICGVLHMLVGILLIMPILAIPVVFLMTMFDESRNVKAFAIFYAIGVAVTYLIWRG